MGASMLKIGEFARLAGLSVGTLRHYEEAGLLLPAQVDEATGYRRYAPEQVGLAHLIVVYRGLGFSLKEIVPLVAAEPSVDDLRVLLRQKTSEVLGRLEAERERLARLAHRIQLIEWESNMTPMEVQTKTLEPMLVAYERIHVRTNPEVPALLGAAYRRVYELIQAAGKVPVGPCLGVWHSSPADLTDETVDAAFPIDGPSERLTTQTLPAGDFVFVAHTGPMDNLGAAHKTLRAWVEANGLTVDGPYREVYLDDGFEVLYPVAR